MSPRGVGSNWAKHIPARPAEPRTNEALAEMNVDKIVAQDDARYDSIAEADETPPRSIPARRRASFTSLEDTGRSIVTVEEFPPADILRASFD